VYNAKRCRLMLSSLRK